MAKLQLKLGWQYKDRLGDIVTIVKCNSVLDKSSPSYSSIRYVGNNGRCYKSDGTFWEFVDFLISSRAFEFCLIEEVNETREPKLTNQNFKTQLSAIEEEIGRVKAFLNQNNFHAGTSVNLIGRRYGHELKLLHKTMSEEQHYIDEDIKSTNTETFEIPQEIKPVLHIEVGRTYKTRVGSLNTITSEVDEGTYAYSIGYRFVGGLCGQYYTANGKTYVNDPEDNPGDLVELIEE